ncbi:MAG: FtsB family cell division protein [Bacteroidia bacterium]
MRILRSIGLFRSPYFWITVGGLLWILWLDTYDVFTQWRLTRQLGALSQQVAFYDSAINAAQKEVEALEKDPYIQEKWAREKYFFHRADEEVFFLESDR